MKTTISSFLLAGVLLLSASCEKRSDSSKISENDIISLKVDQNSERITEQRVESIIEPLFDPEYDAEFNQTPITRSASVETKGLPEEDIFVLIAEVESPKKNGKLLSATSVSINGNYAYVSYHYNEDNNADISMDLYEGVLEVIDISEPTLPVIHSTAHTDEADFNTLAFDEFSTPGQKKLWIGATDFKIAGAVYSLDLQDNVPASDAKLIRHKVTGSKSVNGVSCTSDNLYVSAGRTEGGSYIFDLPNMELASDESFTNAKSVVLTEDKHIVLISGASASIRIYDLHDNHKLIKSFPIGEVKPATGKSGMAVKDDLIWVAMGYNGLKAFNFNGDLIHTFTLPPSDLSDDDKPTTNGVALDNDYIYLANGSGGMYICEATTGVQEIEVLEIYSFDKSTNYINVGQDLIFIANGKDGLKILRRVPEKEFETVCTYNKVGLPDCLQLDPPELCSEIESHIDIALPERENVIKSHPEYFSKPSQLVLTEEASVYFSFIDEGAGKKNSFGAYTYDVNNPPSSIDELENKMLIYPNASKKGSGGSLIPGATMEFVGKLPAGTNIGAYLIFGSWVGTNKTPSGMNEGIYTHYTDDRFNQHELQQSIIFYDEECDAILYCFEDIKATGGDKDYNDCIVQLIVEPASAVDVSQLIPMGK